MSIAAKRNKVASRPERAETHVFKHELQPGQSVTVDVRRELPLNDESGQTAVTSAIIQLDKRWSTPTPEDIAYRALRAKMAGEKPLPLPTHCAAYELLWFGADRVPRDDEGQYVPFPHANVSFAHPVAVMGEEFLGTDAHGRIMTAGCRAIAARGQWIDFGPATMGRHMDFPDGTDPVAFSVQLHPSDPYLVRILNSSDSLLTVACSTPEIDPSEEADTSSY